jgi:hypothetical protein
MPGKTDDLARGRLNMLLDIFFKGSVVKAEVGPFGIEILFLQVIAVVTVEVADRPDGFDHDLKFTRRGFQVKASSRLTQTGGGLDGRATRHSATLLKKSWDVITSAETMRRVWLRDAWVEAYHGGR